MKLNDLKQDGFTFIEQVIVLTIISFLAITAMVSFSNVTIKQKHNAAREEFVFNLRKIQNYAMTGRMTDDEVPAQYGIYIQDNNTYLIFADSDADQRYSAADTVLETVEVDNELLLNPSSATYLSVVPTGSFCYHRNIELPIELDCASARTQQVMIKDTSISHGILIDAVLGDISIEE